MTRSMILVLAALLGLTTCAGCNIPGQIHWSPDGTLAAYVPALAEEAMLIDADGRIVARLGKSLGGFAWSADSSTLYVAAATEGGGGAVVAERNAWLMPSAMQAQPRRRKPVVGELDHMTISAWRAGKAEPIVTTDRFLPLFMELSPDGNWLCFTAAVGYTDKPEGAEDTDSMPHETILYALNLKSKRLYALSDACLFGFCFTGPSRVAHVQFEGAPDLNRAEGEIDVCGDGEPEEAKRSPPGKLVETELSPLEADPKRTVLADATGFVGSWLTRVADDDLLLVKSDRGLEAARDGTLHLFRRRTGKFEPLVEGVQFVSRSPDGKRVLLSREADDMLVLYDVDRRTTRDLRAMDTAALWPAWRGNEQVTLTPPAKPTDGTPPPTRVAGGEKGDVFCYDVVLYELPAVEKPSLKPAKVLSARWDLSEKPRHKPPTRPKPTPAKRGLP
jgi:hypothetical protein